MLTAAAALTAVAGALVALDETRQANAEVKAANVNTHVREFYVAATGLLGSDTLDARLGGLYALERIAIDSPADQRTVVEVLSAFVREHTRALVQNSAEAPPPTGTLRRPVTDVQAALTILGRLPVRDDIRRADLPRANLANAMLTRSNLAGAFLTGSNMTGAFLAEANLSGATIHRTNLTGATMYRTNLAGAVLIGADLTNARLDEANLTDAQLHWADLADASGLVQGQVDVAVGDERTRLPAGIMRPASWSLPESAGS